jgi:hypothetical protein
MLGTRGRYILHHLQKLGEEARQKALQLIKQPRAACNRPFSALGKPSKLCCRPLGDHHGQGVAKLDDIRDDLRVLPIGLKRRVPGKLLQPLRVHWVYLHQSDALLVPQEQSQGFHVWPGGFKANDYFFKTMRSRCRRDPLPKLVEATTAVPKFKRLTFGAVRTAIISVMSVLAAVNGSDKDFLIDPFYLSCFNFVHGYAPFFGLDLPTAQLVPNQERV